MTHKRPYINDIEDTLEAAEKVQQFAGGMTYENFAVVRALEIIEATKRIPEEVRVQYPDIPWRSMAGMRDKLVHDYMGVNWEVGWKTVKEDMPGLKRMMKKILNEIKSKHVR